MVQRIFNTLTRQKEEFVPVTAGKAGIYCCGPTVYAKSHVGHMVGPIIFDAVKRYLAYTGYDVSLVINITDIDDKIIVQAAKEGCAVEALAERVAADYLDNLRRLHVAVDHFPRATKYIPRIQRIIEGLIERGHAYAAGGDVYFDVTSDPDYGKLTNRRIEELLAGTRKEVSDLKRNAGDFALWKGAKPGEPAWESPWGPGRPGWHIECSAMSMELLGETFDIHGGGLDLCFPHHEDEIAQSESYTGKPFAKYWMHNGLMQYGQATRKIGARVGDFASQEADKMSKSKGNIVTISQLLERHSPDIIRFFLLSTHYRSPIDFSDERIEEVGKSVTRLQGYFDRFATVTGSSFHDLAIPALRGPLPFDLAGDPFLTEIAALRDRFLDHMDDDFNTGGAIGVLNELLPLLNRFIDTHHLEDSARAAESVEALQRGTRVLRELTGVLGLFLEKPAAPTVDDSLSPQLIELLIEVRNEARKSKNFAMSDMIRDRLNALGVELKDRPDGTQWHRHRQM